MGISNIESRTPLPEIYAEDLDECANVNHKVAKNLNQILADSIASKPVLAEPLLPPDVQGDSGEFADTVRSASNVLANLNPDEARCDLYAILALMLHLATEDREGQRAIRQTGNQKLVTIQLDAAQRIRDSADKKMWGSIAAGVGQVLGGAVSLGGGVMAVRAGAQSASALAESEHAKGLLNDQLAADRFKTSAESWQRSAQTWNAVTPGASQLPGALTGFGQASLENQAAKFDAQRAELDAIARKQEQVTQEVNEHMQQQLDVMRDVLDKLRSLEQSRKEINSGISHNI